MARVLTVGAFARLCALRPSGHHTAHTSSGSAASGWGDDTRGWLTSGEARAGEEAATATATADVYLD